MSGNRHSGALIDKARIADLLAWWLTQDEIRHIEANGLETLPAYIRCEIESMSGRPKRGRLWVSPDLGRVPDYPPAVADWIGRQIWLEDKGGVVVRREDLSSVTSFDRGLFTPMFGPCWVASANLL